MNDYIVSYKFDNRTHSLKIQADSLETAYIDADTQLTRRYKGKAKIFGIIKVRSEVK